ncbi:DNA topoisomerase 2, variant 2 [Dermatophagoides farinae]|uniref:DNA topoisomerase 2, variant 2 n=1 Tax=Dermatophagoides farinae TaxID=6954 RepID=A0A922I5H7_DERFA|nr:DNA topoisomerase 2, variant 2 [Dermatophagoides farinae]
MKTRTCAKRSNTNTFWEELNFSPKNGAQGSSPPVKKSRIDEPCQIEHILFRPNIGSVEKVTKQMWVYASQDGMVLRDVSYVPQLYKILMKFL